MSSGAISGLSISSSAVKVTVGFFAYVAATSVVTLLKMIFSVSVIREFGAAPFGGVLPATALTENDHMLFSIIPFSDNAPQRRIALAYRRNFVRPKALGAIRQAILSSQLAGVSFIKE